MNQKLFPALLAIVSFGSACDDASKSDGAPASASPAPTPAPIATEPPPDPHRNDYKQPSTKGSVAFANLKDGAKVVGQNIMGMVAAELEFEVKGMTTAEEGPVKQDTGHFLVIIDGEAIPEQKVAEESAKVRKFGNGETTGTIPLSEGKHTLTLQFVDARDRSYGEAWSSTINVTAASK